MADGWTVVNNDSDGVYSKDVDGATTTAAVHDRSVYFDAVGEIKAGTYSLFDAFAILKYKGNTTRAAKDIERLGFGGLRMPSLTNRELNG